MFDRGPMAYTVYNRRSFDRVSAEYKLKLETYHLVPHFYDVFIAVIESKVAVEKRGNSQCR